MFPEEASSETQAIVYHSILISIIFGKGIENNEKALKNVSDADIYQNIVLLLI